NIINQNIMNKIKDKVALVTGASKGIGASIAIHLAKEGAKVVVNYASSNSDAEKVVSTIINEGGTAIALKGDVSIQADVDRIFRETEIAFGGLDILVNNAGVFEYLPIEELTEESFHKQFNINVLGSILSIQKAVQLFGTKGGSIINISSEASKLPLPTVSIYSASKAALDAITVSLSKELSGRNIRINSLLPGVVDTVGSREAGFIGTEAEKDMISKTPLGRTGQPADIAKVAVFLASDQANWINGQKISVTGGIFGL